MNDFLPAWINCLRSCQLQLQRTGVEGSSFRLKVGLPDKLQAGMYILKVQSNEFSEVFKVLVKE